jgi:hypothetical protein
VRGAVAALAKQHGIRDRRRAPIRPEPLPRPEQLLLAI